MKKWSITLFYRAVIDIGTKDIGVGSTYVALSRLRTFEGLYFISKNYDRFLQINNNILLKCRKRAEQELLRLEAKMDKRFLVD